MYRFSRLSILRMSVTALFLITLLPAMSFRAAAQSSDTSYTSDAYGVTVTWTDAWVPDLSGNTSPDFDFLSLERDKSMMLFIYILDGAEFTPEEGVWLLVEDNSEIVDDQSASIPPRLSFTDPDMGFQLVSEAYSVDGGDTTVVVTLMTIPVLVEPALESIPPQVLVNGSPVLTGQPLADSGDATDLTGNATSEATQATTRTSRTSTSGDETPEATEESTTEVIRTSRTSGDETPEATEESTTEVTRTSRTSGDETPEATEVPTEEPTEEPGLSQGLDTFTGPVYGYSVSYDPSVWTLDTEIEDETTDGIRLVSDTSTFTIWAWDAYGSDPLACLDGEAEYYAQSDTISDWAPVTGSDGEPLRYESEDLAWGVFNLSYTSSSGDTFPLVDYISCEPIPGQDAVLIVLLSSDPAPYNDNLDLALDVLDTLEFAGTNTPSDTTSETTPDAGNDVVTNLNGTEYISPNFGFTAEIPLEWQILDESANGTDETLVVGNGTSEVTLWATAEYGGDLEGCVDFAANASGLDLVLDSNATGGEFRGTYGGESFGNFVYDSDGTKMMYFIKCEPIGDTGGFLILIQDVNYDSFASERRARTSIENGITMP